MLPKTDREWEDFLARKTPLGRARWTAVRLRQTRFTAPAAYKCKKCKGLERYTSSGTCVKCANSGKENDNIRAAIRQLAALDAQS